MWTSKEKKKQSSRCHQDGVRRVMVMKDSGRGSRSSEPSKALAPGKERVKEGWLAQKILCLQGIAEGPPHPAETSGTEIAWQWVLHWAGQVLGLLFGSVTAGELPGESRTLIQMLWWIPRCGSGGIRGLAFLQLVDEFFLQGTSEHRTSTSAIRDLDVNHGSDPEIFNVVKIPGLCWETYNRELNIIPKSQNLHKWYDHHVFIFLENCVALNPAIFRNISAQQSVRSSPKNVSILTGPSLHTFLLAFWM